MEQERKDCILRAAVKAFTRFGFRKTSVDEIAKDAGVAKGTIYLACESKEDLFYQAVHRETREWVAEAAKRIDPRVPADELMQTEAFRSVAEFDHKPLVKSLLNGECAELLPHWDGRLQELRALCAKNIEEILTLGIRQGRFRADIDVESVAMILLDMQIATLTFFNKPGGDRDERLVRRAAAAFDLLLKGLSPRGESRAKPPKPVHAKA